MQTVLRAQERMSGTACEVEKVAEALDQRVAAIYDEARRRECPRLCPGPRPLLTPRQSTSAPHTCDRPPRRGETPETQQWRRWTARWPS